MAWKAKCYIALIVTAGVACLVTANWDMAHGLRFACYLVICILASAMKVNLPGILGTMSVSFLFILIGILDMSAGQTMLIGCAGALVQCVWKPKSQVRPVQAVFSVMNIAVAVLRRLLPLPLAAAAAARVRHPRCADRGLAGLFRSEHHRGRRRGRAD